MCGKELFRPSTCRLCGKSFCSSHVSPKAHSCPNYHPMRIRRPGKRTSLFIAAAVIAASSFGLIALRHGEQPTGARRVPYAGGIQFVDVTNGSGLGVVASGHGLAVEDLDGDWDLDVYVVNKDGNLFFRNEGNGSFTDVTEQTGVGRGPGGGHGVAVGDYDNDGDRDIFCANWMGGEGSPNLLYRNDGNFSFTDVTRESGLDVGDPGRSHSACMGDYNNDGWLDIIATNVEGNNFYFVNKRDGRFLYSNALGRGDAPHGLVSVDYDLDGDLDVYLSNQAWGDRPPSDVFYENRGGKFVRVTSRVGLHGETHSSFFGDFDGDGDYDFFGVDRASKGAKAYYRNVGKRFKEVSREVGARGPVELVHGMDCADFDNDGDLDVLLTGGHETILLANRGDGTFEDVTRLVGLDIDFGNPKAVCFFDFDDDGDQDLYVVIAGGRNRLFESVGNTNHWIKIDLVGIDSNRDGIGARIELFSGNLSQYSEVPSGRGHIHDSIERCFGLGRNEVADLIRVRWPSGQVQEVRNVPADQRIVITEGRGWEPVKK